MPTFKPDHNGECLHCDEWGDAHICPTMQLNTGDDPALGHCRICGLVKVPPYPGYYRDAICSKECFDEWKWRETLHIVRKPYYPQPPK